MTARTTRSAEDLADEVDALRKASRELSDESRKWKEKCEELTLKVHELNEKITFQDRLIRILVRNIT